MGAQSPHMSCLKSSWCICFLQVQVQVVEAVVAARCGATSVKSCLMHSPDMLLSGLQLLLVVFRLSTAACEAAVSSSFPMVRACPLFPSLPAPNSGPQPVLACQLACSLLGSRTTEPVTTADSHIAIPPQHDLSHSSCCKLLGHQHSAEVPPCTVSCV